MADISVEVDIVCGACGDELGEYQGRTKRPHVRNLQHPIIVEPCATCLDTARDEGHAAGEKEAVEHVQDMVRIVRATPQEGASNA